MWNPKDTAPRGEVVNVLYNTPSGEIPVEGVYRQGNFHGQPVLAWWGADGGLLIDSWVLGWKAIEQRAAA